MSNEEILQKVNLDLEALNTRFRKKERVLKILNIFFVDFDKQLDMFRVAYKENNLKIMKDVSHTLKGMSGNLSLDLIYKIAYDLDNALLNGEENLDYEDICEKLELYNQYYKKSALN